MITLTKEEVIERAKDASTLAAEMSYKGVHSWVYELACQNNHWWQRKLDEIDEIEESKK